MNRKSAHSRFLMPAWIVVLLGLLVTLSATLFSPQVATAVADPTTAAIQQAWNKAQQSNTYTFDSHIEQTTYPLPALSNVGRQPQTDNIFLTGQRDQAQDLIEMTLWQNARGSIESGISVRSQDGRTFRRTPSGEWEEQNDMGDLFAPGGDPLTFLQTATNITSLGTDTRELGNLTFAYEKYSFDLDTTAYARVLRQQLDAQLAQFGTLPAGMTLETPEVYRKMSGQGELWIDGDGLPQRLEMTLTIPPQGNNGQAIARITTDLSGFDKAQIEATAVPFWQSPSTWWQAHQADLITGTQQTTRTAVWLFVGVGLLLLVVPHWRSRRFYAAIASVLVLSMLFSPLLQVAQADSFQSSLQAAQAKAEARQAESEVQADRQAEMAKTDWHPNKNPLDAKTATLPETAVVNTTNKNPLALAPALAPELALANTITDTTDTDGDGLIDLDEEFWGTNPNATDTDGDGLSDGVEVHDLGTHPDVADTDMDGITDADEISGFDYNGQTWYLNPQEMDSNKDGLIDGLECRARTQTIPADYDPAAVCPDTDGDGTPDLFDADNDGDDVPDQDDLSPFSASDGAYDDLNPLQINISNLALDKPVFVDFQFRPINDSNLNLYNHVLDWPSQDEQGQIRRMLNTTWADTANLDLRSDAANAANGDIRLVPMLEITMPYTDGHYANLPVTTTAPIDRVLGTPVDDWLDTSDLVPHGIDVSEAEDGTLSTYLPLNQVIDRYGRPQAFQSRMVYRPSQGSAGRAEWGSDHEVRMIWLVQMITDQCPAGYDEMRTGEDDTLTHRCINPQNGTITTREDVLTIGHIYPDSWQLTGLSISEEHDFDMAILYEDPAQGKDSDLTADDQLMVASWNLSTGFMIGRDCDTKDGNGVCQGDGNRDVTVENLATAVSSWFTDTYYINVETYTDYDHGAYLTYLIGTEVQPLLDTHFGAHTDTIPTFMYVQDHTSRELNLDTMIHNSAAGLITTTAGAYSFDVSPDDVPVQVKSSFSWTPYQYIAGEWQAAELDNYLTRLDSRLQEEAYFQPADDSEAAAEEAADSRLLIQTYYASLWLGVSAITALADQPLNARGANPNIPDSDYDPFFTPGTDYGATMLALKFFEIAGGGGFSFIRSVGLGGVAGFTILVLVTWAAIALMFAGDKQLARIGELVLAGLTLAIGTMQAINALIAISNGGLSAGTSFPAIGIAGLVISLAIAWGVLLITILTQDMTTLAIQVAVSIAIATTIFTLALFAISLMGLGVLGILLFLVDAIFLIMGKKGPSTYIIEFLASQLFDVDMSVTNLGDGDRLDIQVHGLDLLDERQGFRETNSILVTMGITNTIKYHRDLSESRVALRNVFSYTLQTGLNTVEKDLNYWDDTATDQWTPLSGRNLQTNYENSLTVSLASIGPGLNQPLDGVKYTESFLTGAQTCWNIPTSYGTVQTACNWTKFRDAVHYPLSEMLVYDIFPASVSKFAWMEWSDTVPELPRQVDQDADSISDLFGADPYYGSSGYDTDGDGLGDLYEISNGYNPSVADGDFDGLNDYEELILGTNPFLKDTDGDGLNDHVETVEGWLIVYDGDQLTRVWSDPFSVDADGDGLSDRDELIFGFNPWTATDPSQILNLVKFDNLGVVETGAPAVLLQFEDAANSTAFYDSSENGHHGLCTGTSCPTVASNGRYAQALSFDGTDDFATIPDTEAINLGIHPEHTISVWFYVDDATINSRKQVIYEQGATGRGLNLYVYDGQLYGGGWNASGSGWGGNYISTPILSGQWYHAALALDGGTAVEPDALTLYLNGQFVGSESGSQLLQHTGNVGIGAYHNDTKFHDGNASGDGGYLAGRVDELAIMNRAITVDEVADVMNGRYNPNDNLLAPNTDLTYQATVTNTSSTTATGFLVGESAYFDPALRHPVAAYSFEPEERLAYFVDETGGESAIVCVDNGACPAQISGQNNAGYDTGLWFNGTTHTMRLPAMSAKTASEAFNLSFWVNLNSYPAPGERMMLVDTDSDEPGAIDIYINSSGNVVVDIVGHPNGPGVDSRVLNLNNNHISLNGHYQLYINGSYEFLNNWYIYGTPPDSYQIGPGTLGNSLEGSEPFYGQIDELVFFNDFRDNANNEINNIKNGNYNDNTQLFRFEDLINYNGTIFYDSQNNANHAACSGATCPSLTLAGGGYNGRAAIFDGADDYATQPGNFTTQPSLPSETNITLFVNPADYPTTGTEAYLYDTEAVGSGTTVTFDLYLDENGQLTLDYGRDSRTFNTVIPKNQWSKVQVVFARFMQSGIVQFRAYLRVNDVQDSNEASICSGSNSCQSTVRVGNGRIGNNLAGTAPFNGMLDELNLRISNINFDPPTVNVGYDNRANELRSARCPDVFACPAKSQGRYGSSIQLDGVEEYLTLDTPVDPAIEPFTAAMWFKTANFSNEPIFLQQTNGAGTGQTWLGLRTDGRLYSYLGGSFLNGTTTVTPNTWHHAAVTYDGTTLRLYLDGVEEAASARTMEASDGEMELGRHPSIANRYFTGQLDELVVMATAVTPDKLQLLMNSQWPMIDVPVEFVPFSTTALTSQEVSGLAPVSPYATTSVHRFDQEVEAALELQAQISYPVIDNNAADLEMYIPFEDGPGTMVFDNLISYPNGFADPDMEALCASAGTCPTAGLRGQVERAAYFDGRDDYLLLDAEYLSGWGPSYVTAVSVWVNAERGTILDINRGPTNSDRSLDVSLDRVLTYDGSTMRTLAYNAPRNEWFHLVVSIDNSNQGTVYVNGTAVATGTLDAGLDNFTEYFNIGTNHNGYNLLKGYLDDLRLYSAPLTQADVTALYETSAPLLRFEFDEDEGATIFTDNSLNQYIGQPQIKTGMVDGETISVSNPSPGTPGRIGNGLVLDGTGYVEVNAPDVAALTESFTVMGWIKPSLGGYQQIFSPSRENSDNGWSFRVRDGRLGLSAYGVANYYTADGLLQNDVWQHVAVVFDSNYDATFYIDGENVGTIIGSNPVNANLDDVMRIGATSPAGSSNIVTPFKGSLDELAVYGREMSTAEIYGIYLRELRWYRDKATTYLTIDTDNPTIQLLSNAAYWPNGYTQLAVATTDPTSAVNLLDFGLKAPGETEFSWQGAPLCAESAAAGGANGAAWCPYFDSSLLGGEGVYELQFRAVDAVGNETLSNVYALYVDDTPPTAQSNVNGFVNMTAVADSIWQITLDGTLADPDLSGTAVAGSGVVSNTVLVQLLDNANGLVSGSPQLATVTGNNWTVDYVMSGLAPHGVYTITITLEDSVGNVTTIATEQLIVDERPPSVDVHPSLSSVSAISQTVSIFGAASSLPNWGSSVVEHHFEESAGATLFYNTTSYEFYTRTHSFCTTCPTSNQPSLFGVGVQFDGVDDVITIPNVISPTAETLAASVWFNVTNLASARTILQQTDGNGVGRTWLYVATNGTLQSYIGGSALASATAVNVNEWHHAAVTYDGEILRLYLDGRLEASETRTLEFSDGYWLLGVNKSGGNRFVGLMDEFNLYDRALKAEEVYGLAQSVASGVQRVQVALLPVNFAITDTLPITYDEVVVVDDSGANFSQWQYTFPTDLTEGFYELYLRGVDLGNHLGRDEGVWRSLIDMVEPAVTATGQHTWQNGTPVTEYSFTFSDFLLDGNSYDQPCANGDLITQTYNDANLPHDGLPYEVSATCQVNGHESSRDFTVCDTVGHCTTVTVNPSSVTQYPLSVNVNGNGTVTSNPAGISCGDDCAETYEMGTVVTLTAVADTGYTFTDWGGACSGTGDCVVTMDQARSVTANFTLNQYALTATVDGNGSVTSVPAGISCGADCSESYDYGTVVTLTAVADSGSTFSGWSGACSGVGDCVVTIDGTKSVTATFEVVPPDQYALSVLLAGDGFGTVTGTGIDCSYAPDADCSQIYTAGTVVTLTAVADLGSTFSGWSGACTNATGDCVVTMDQAHSVTANFTLNQYALTVTVDGNGSVTSAPMGISCGADCAENYDYGTVVTLTAVADNGSTFTGWSGACSGVGDCAVTMNQTKSVTATFAVVPPDQYALSVLLAGNGFGTVMGIGIDCSHDPDADCSEIYIDGTEVTLTAIADTGSTFTGWSGACTNTTGNCVVTMTEARSVTANFTLNQYDLTVTVSGNGTVMSDPGGIDCGVDCTETYDYGTVVTLTAVADIGSTFIGWDGACTNTTGNCIVTMTSAKSVTAKFAKEGYRIYLPVIFKP